MSLPDDLERLGIQLKDNNFIKNFDVYDGTDNIWHFSIVDNIFSRFHFATYKKFSEPRQMSDILIKLSIHFFNQGFYLGHFIKNYLESFGHNYNFLSRPDKEITYTFFYLWTWRNQTIKSFPESDVLITDNTCGNLNTDFFSFDVFVYAGKFNLEDILLNNIIICNNEIIILREESVLPVNYRAFVEAIT